MSTVTLDLILIAFMLVLIYYCFRLNRNISNIRKKSDQLKSTLRTFTAVNSYISKTIDRLSEISNTLNTEFVQNLPKAESLKNDLDYLMQHGNKLADRMDETMDKIKEIDPIRVNLKHPQLKGFKDDETQKTTGSERRAPFEAEKSKTLGILNALKGIR